MLYYAGIVTLAVIVGILSTNDPETVQGISMAGLCSAILATVLYRVRKQAVDGKWLARVILLGLFIRLALTFVHLAVGFWFYQGQLDFPGYHDIATNVGRGLLTGDWSSMQVEGIGNQSTAYLLGLFYLMSGPGIVGMFLLSAVIGFLGSYFFFCAFEIEFPDAKRRTRRFVALSLFLLPSLTYWGILLGKDSWIYFFLGGASYAFVSLLRKFRVSYLLGLTVSLLGATLIRLPVGGILTLAMGCAFMLKRGRNGPAALLRPLRVLGLGGASFGAALVIVSTFLGEYDLLVSRVSLVTSALEVVKIKHEGLSTDPTAGGSSLESSIADASFGAVLGYLPVGMFSLLFRPFLFEAHHFLALFAALESTFLLVLVLWKHRSLAMAMRRVFRRPFINFCALAFFLLTAVLSLEPNFGVMVRHRTMVLPFLIMLLATPRDRRQRRGSSLGS